MEAAAEKMEALKKVYADIILNMAKESSARILASERRAVLAERGHAAAKEEALATLLRVKSAMDAKVRETETISLGQLRKIQELESQLSVAEDTICSLRTELKRVNNKLAVNNELAKTDNIAEPLSGQNISGHETTCVAKCLERKNSPDSVLCSPVGSGHIVTFDSNIILSQRTPEGYPCSTELAMKAESVRHLSVENGFVGNPDLASIIMRSKEPELYRNGCTQRIRALEHNLLTAKGPLGQSDDQSLNLKSALVNCVNGKVKRPCSMDSATIESQEFVKQGTSFGNGQFVRFPLKAPKKRRGRRNHIKPINCRTVPDRETADDKPYNLVRCKWPKDRKNFPRTPFRQGSPWLLECSRTSASKQNVTRKSHSDPEDQILKSPSSGTENTSGRNSVRYPLLTGMKDGPLIGHAQDNSGDTPQEQVSVLMASDQTVTIGNPEIGDVPIINLDIKDEKNCVSSGAAQAGRFLKYTFQRKRKRVPADSKEGNSLLEEKSVLQKSEDKQNALRDPQMIENSREDRRLALVARQLISLSERRW